MALFFPTPVTAETDIAPKTKPTAIQTSVDSQKIEEIEWNQPEQGNFGQRNNNPLNITCHKSHWAEKGLAKCIKLKDGRKFFSYATPEIGWEAARELLTSKWYKDLSVDAAMRRWSNNGYGNLTDIDKKVKDLTEEELSAIMEKMASREGYFAKIK